MKWMWISLITVVVALLYFNIAVDGAKLQSSNIITKWPKVNKDLKLTKLFSDKAKEATKESDKLNNLWLSYYHSHKLDQFHKWLSAWENAQKPPKNQTVPLLSFSIVLPCYNCEKTLPDTLKSLDSALNYLHKKYKEVPTLTKKPLPQGEIIFVNDGSTDRSEDVIKNYIDTHPFTSTNIQTIFVNEEVNTGYGPARNQALRRVHNDLIFFLDADDLYKKEHIYYLLLVASISGLPHVWSRVDTSDEIHFEQLNIVSNTLLMAKAFRREILDLMPEFPDMGGTKELGHIGGEDGIYVMGMMKYFPDYILMPAQTATYCRHPGNNFDLQYDKWQLPPNQDGSIPDSVNTEREKKTKALQNVAYQRTFAKWDKRYEELLKNEQSDNSPKKPGKKSIKDEL